VVVLMYDSRLECGHSCPSQSDEVCDGEENASLVMYFTYAWNGILSGKQGGTLWGSIARTRTGQVFLVL
jgi:hypothetical protein